MSNLRVIYQNVADTATITASTTAGSLAAANLKTDMKSNVWRATTTSAQLNLVWAAEQLIQGVALPFCNLTSEATIRVRASDDNFATTLYDSGLVLAAPAAPLDLWDWGTAPLGSNAYAYGGGTTGRLWMDDAVAATHLRIDLTDPTNPDGYLEASRLVAGIYWEPAKNADYGASVRVMDTSKNFRNGAGDLMTDPGTLHTRLNFSMSKMDPTDRRHLWNILRGNGISRPVFVSLFPDSADTDQEQMHQIYGKLVDTPAMSIPSFNISSSTLDIEAI